MSGLWEKLRKDFLIPKRGIYLDHAAGGPIPKPVLEKIQKHYRENAGQADFVWMKWCQQRDEARESVAKFINARPEEIAFTTSTSHGMNAVAHLLSKKGGVLTNTSEFPSSTLPWLWRKAKVIWQKPHENRIELAALKSLLNPSVKTIVSSYVQYATGFRQDLESLGKMKGSRFLVVNATQGFGAFPVDVQKWKADFLVTNSYKWLMAGYGGGILYIRKEHLAKMDPDSVGWRSMQLPDLMDNQRLDLKQEASRYELGCPGFPPVLAVAAACDYLRNIGREKIEQRILALTDFAIDRLQSKGIEILSPLERPHRSGIVILKVKDPGKLWKRLLNADIFVTPRGGGLRLAPHFYNTEGEIEKVINSVERLA